MAKRKRMTATQRERALLQQQVRRMESRGYRISDEIKAKIASGKYQTLHSLRRNKYAKLYSGASAEVDGKIVGGQEYRKIQRSESAQKAAETRRQERLARADFKEAPSKEELERELYGETKEESRQRELELEQQRREQAEWERRRREQDARDRRRAADISQGETMYQNIVDLVEKFPMRKGANILSRGLQSEISKYGRDNVLAAMANAPGDLVDAAQNIIYYTEGAEALHGAIVSFFEAITSTIISQQEAQEIGDYMDEITDMSAP